MIIKVYNIKKLYDAICLDDFMAGKPVPSLVSFFKISEDSEGIVQSNIKLDKNIDKLSINDLEDIIRDLQSTKMEE